MRNSAYGIPARAARDSSWKAPFGLPSSCSLTPRFNAVADDSPPINLSSNAIVRFCPLAGGGALWLPHALGHQGYRLAHQVAKHSLLTHADVRLEGHAGHQM